LPKIENGIAELPRKGEKIRGMAEEIILHGFKELDDKLHTLPDKVARKILRQSCVEGAKVIAAEADRIVRSKVRIKHRGKTTSIQTSQHYSEVTSRVGPSGKKWYLKFFETGTIVSDKTMAMLKHTAKVRERMARRVRGMWRIAPRPWLRPALDISKEKVLEKVGQDLGQRIEIEAGSSI